MAKTQHSEKIKKIVRVEERVCVERVEMFIIDACRLLEGDE